MEILKNYKKTIGLVGIISSSIAAIISILIIFGLINDENKFFLSILFSACALCGIIIFLLMSLSFMIESKKVAIPMLSLFGLSLVFLLIAIWVWQYAKNDTMIFKYIASWLASLSFFFAVFLNRRYALKERLLPLQIIGYTFLGFTLIEISLWLCELDFIFDSFNLFISCLIIAITFFIILFVQRKTNKESTILIKEEEYKELLKIKEEYEKIKK